MKKHNLQLYFTIVILIIIIATQTLANLLTSLLGHIFGLPFDIPVILWNVILGIVLGSILTVIFSTQFIAPIFRLNRAMQRVAEGDFTIHLETRSQIRDIRDSYSNFNAMVRELASTEMLQSDFISNVSHEFKTPINAIEGYAMLLQDDAGISAEQEECIDKILFNTKRLSSLVGNILLMSKVENQRISIQKNTFRLDEQIRQSIVMLEPQWSAKKIAFDIEMEEIDYVGYENLLSHVWNNLIGNAIKFDPEQGFISIRLTNTGDRIAFTIRDNGPGVREDQYLRIFEKFYQADSSHKDEGNGLGLALAKQIVEASGGEIQVRNADEGGCIFTVLLRGQTPVNFYKD